MARGGVFTLYINKQRIGNYYDNTNRQPEGYFGYLAHPESGVSSCTYSDTRIWLLDKE